MTEERNYQGIPFSEIGIDYDFQACASYNTVEFDLSDINSVVAVHEGENDEDNWIWVVYLKDSRYALVDGWCDYTGWDCQSGASTTFGDNPFELVRNHSYSRGAEIVISELLEQLSTIKKKTWREETDKIMSSNYLTSDDVLRIVREQKNTVLGREKSLQEQLDEKIVENIILSADRDVMAWLLFDVLVDTTKLPDPLRLYMENVHAEEFDMVYYRYVMAHTKDKDKE